MTAATARVLLLSSDDEPMDAISTDLTDAGFDVVSCHEPGSPSFPCVGMAGGACPIELAGGLDLVLDVRQHSWPNPTLRETGMTCAVRMGVPGLVLTDQPHPFEPFAETSSPDGDVVEACEDAMAGALEGLRAAVADEAAAVLATHGIDDAPLAVFANRRLGRLHLRIAVAAPSDVRAMIATRAAVAVRRVDHTARSLEIEVVAPVLAS